MSAITKTWPVDISQHGVRNTLQPRNNVYWKRLSWGRFVGYQKRASGTYWVARYLGTTGNYHQRQLAATDDILEANGKTVLTYDDARLAAESWFNTPQLRRLAVEDRPIGVTGHLKVCPAGPVFTVSHALHDYVEWKRVAAASSNFPTILSMINHHIVPRLATLALSDFTSEISLQFIKDVLETPPKRGNRPLGLRRSVESMDFDELRKRKKTANQLISILRNAFLMAWENGKTDSERPWRCLRYLRLPEQPRSIHLDRKECARLLRHCRPDLRNLVLGALYTGCRAGELLRMRCSDVGRDGFGVYVLPAKTYKPRFVFLPDEGMAWFLAMIAGRNPGEFVFLNGRTGRKLDRYKHLFKEAVCAAGLPEDLSFHSLRHTYASQLVQAGAAIPAVAEQLGHRDGVTVLRTYAHLTPQIRESEVRQRFSAVSQENVRLARREKRRLQSMRSEAVGHNWTTYAQINDMRTADRPLRQRQYADRPVRRERNTSG